MFPKAAHFQLTSRCNLKCHFCGQRQGMLATKNNEFSLDFWLKIVDKFFENGVTSPSITLWGGEPLLYPDIEILGKTLSQKGCQVEIVTNGTLIAQHADFLNNYVDKIHLSIDGTAQEHNLSRGEGVFEKISQGLPLLNNRKGKLIFLTTISDYNVDKMSELPHKLSYLKPDEIILQPLMYLDTKEIDSYLDYSRKFFATDYPEIRAWQRDDYQEYLVKLNQNIAKMEKESYPMSVKFSPHCNTNHICQQPWQRVHIKCNGEVGFCTDYFGFSLGNIKENSIKDLFNSKNAKLFRDAVENHKLTICNHCPWRLQ